MVFGDKEEYNKREGWVGNENEVRTDKKNVGGKKE